MIAVVSLLLIATFFITASRVATIALVGTGMTTDAASFQTRSAFMGVGYTTAEAEDAINHPVRRRIILWLMTLGNAGIITGISSMVLGFVDAEPNQTARRVTILVVGLLVLLLLTRVSAISRLLTRFTRYALGRWTTLDTRDLASLLRFADDFGIVELRANSGDWIVDRPLRSLHLPDEGVVVLGLLRKSGEFLGVPTGHSQIREGDTVIAYGRLHHLEEVDDRMRDALGDMAHEEAVRQQEQLLENLPDD